MYKALLVDDDQVVLKTLEMVFKARHFDVTAATSARDAVKLLSSLRFDLVLTDMRMETDTAGFDVVRCAASLSNRPVIAILSAYPIPPSEWRSSGADALFAKGGGTLRMIDELEHMLTSRLHLSAS